ncbi:Serine/threonine-protein kinase PknA [Micromonospora sp. MW-13]|uniref:serine/threonine-protein kinase n=1 Tax=Micromonospora sp. MW-13 TaxID=2094022 RepID=UPI000E43DD22|nr:serine/threonine-protein kinase [Micromonospora sp. MW-13]RGC69367.1 Serine/threonine-protein kinase PknA [Micromonospora sp. MW-13]
MLHSGLRLGGRYRLDTRIGAGGMGEVWRAVDEVLGRVVAVKAMLPEVADEPDFARRFLAEAKAMASVNHPAVASIHDYGRGDGVTFLVMEFVDGESLAGLLRRTGRLAPEDAMRLIAQAADGLQAVHDCGIVHRDVKPANLLIRRNGSVLITDFGISRTWDGTHLTVSGAVLGTPSYLSPEQVLGQPATALSDVYALGLTAYECLAGHRPFAGDSPYAMALQRVRTVPRPLGGDLPHPVLAVVDRALATDPAGRWPCAAALADAARAAADGRSGPGGRRPPPAAPPGVAVPSPAGPARPGAAPVPAVGPRTARRRWPLLAALPVIALVGGVALWQATGPGRHDGPASGAGPRQPSTAPTDDAARQAGFTSCGAAFCPTRPLCWRGLTSISGNAMPPRRVDCTTDHAWETFSATYLPADAVDIPQDELLARADIGAACSASVMAARTAGRPTTGWVREAWPIQLTGTDVWLVHCLARPQTGDPSGSAFSTR